MESFYDTNESNRSHSRQLFTANSIDDDDDDVKIIAQQHPILKMPQQQPSKSTNMATQALNWPPKPKEKPRFATFGDIKKEAKLNCFAYVILYRQMILSHFFRPAKPMGGNESDSDSANDDAESSEKDNNGRQSFFVGGGYAKCSQKPILD